MKDFLKRFPLVVGAVRRLRFFRRRFLQLFFEVKLILWSPFYWLRYQSQTMHSERLLVAVTSYPERIDQVWKSIESIIQQSVRPQKLVLVLASEQFPEKRLPFFIRWQFRRGLEVFWSRDDLKSYKKLIPIVENIKGYNVITVDDDVIYSRHLIKHLLEFSQLVPDRVIGTRGWSVEWSVSGFTPYTQWSRPKACSDDDVVLLTGVGGILYPKDILELPLLTDYSVASRLCPTADDIWFWAVIRFYGYSCVSTNRRMYVENFSLSKRSKLTDVNWTLGRNDKALSDVLEFFGSDGLKLS